MAKILLKIRNFQQLKWSSSSFSSTALLLNDAEQMRKDLFFLNPEEAEQRKRLKESCIKLEGPTDLTPISGIPEEHLRSRRVRIYEPAKNCMQSGTNNIHHWEMEFDARERWENPLMGWCSTGDPLSNMQLKFATKEDAIAHCEKYCWKWFLQEGTTAKPVKPKVYADIYSWDRRVRSSTK